jgi:hypothetical protein
MGLKNHNSHGAINRHERIDGRTSWKTKIRLIAMAVWIIGAALIGSGLYLLFSGGETFTKVIGGVIFLAGALLIGFSRDLRDWIFTKW